MSRAGSPVLDRLCAGRPDAVLSTHVDCGDATAVVDAELVHDVLAFLRDEPELAFEMLVDLTAVDLLPREPRFQVVYHLHSLAHGHRIRIKAGVASDHCEIASATGLWPAADWLEREVFDLYGLRFRGHPDLRRILLDDGFRGHPLRKDFPKTGHRPLRGPGSDSGGE